MDLKTKKRLKYTQIQEQEPKQSIKKQASRIQTKLQSLKEQIQMKKKHPKTADKSSSNLDEKLSRFLKTNEFERQKDEMMMVLQKIKAEQYYEKIKAKGIQNLVELLLVEEEKVDQWKDIPVGYRVKLKKYINQHKKLRKQESHSKDIQMIMKERENNRKFVPITNIEIQDEFQDREEGSDVFEEGNSQDEDILMKSLDFILRRNERKSIIKGRCDTSKQKISPKKKVHWSIQVQDFNKQTSSFKGDTKSKTFYPIQKQNPNSSSYCWNCLKRIAKGAEISHFSRLFCQQQCLNSYKEKIIEEDHDSVNQGKKQSQDIYELDLSIS